MHEDPRPIRASLTDHAIRRASRFGAERKVSLIAAGALGLTVLMLALVQLPTHREGQLGESDDIAVGQATITGAQIEQLVPSDIAIERLTYVKCSHAASCSSTSMNEQEPFEGEDECSRVTRVRLSAELDGATICARGVEPTQLEQCVNAIEAASCGRGSQQRETEMACRPSALCPPVM